MKIIILAAGVGSRLRPLTQNVPKSLLKVSNNETVIERTIKMINKKIKCDIIIVTGFKSEKFADIDNKIKKYYIEDDECKEIIDLCMNKNKADQRKIWIGDYNPNNIEELNQQEIQFKKFFNNEFIQYSIDDCSRSIPLSSALRVAFSLFASSGLICFELIIFSRESIFLSKLLF